MATKVTVDYEHRPEDLQAVYLAVVASGRPAEEDWRPALRDVVDGRHVVWARFDLAGRGGTIWLRDRSGDHQVGTHRI